MTDILIIGANPTGLILATALIRKGISVKIIDHRPPHTERREDRFDIPVILSPPSLELLHSSRLFNEETLPGQRLYGTTHFWDKHSLNLTIFNNFLNRSLSAFPYFYTSNYSLLEDHLIKYFEQDNGHIDWSTRPVTMVDNNIFIEKIDTGNTFEHREVLNPKFILACESDSNPYINDILKQSGKTKKATREITVLSCPFIKESFKNRINIFSRSGSSGYLIFPDPEGKQSLLWTSTGTKRSKSHLENLTDFLGIENLDDQKIYRTNQTVVPHRKDNILFIGNIFNTFFLSSRAGINLNILSAFNLIWKLLPVMHDKSAEKLVSSYEQEMTSAYKTASGNMKKNALIQSVTNRLFPGMSYWMFKGYHLINALQKSNTPARFSINYAPSIITGQNSQNRDAPGPLPGEYAPDILIEEGKYLLEDVSDSKHLLLFFKDRPGLIQSLLEDYGSWLNVKIVKSREAKELYKANEESLFIIRPDRYIGYRSLFFKTRELITYLLKIFPNPGEITTRT